jgi:hypothetical protein
LVEKIAFWAKSMTSCQFHDVEQGDQNYNQCQKNFPGARVVFPVCTLVFTVRPYLCDDKHRNEEYDKSNLAWRKFHLGGKGNARRLKSYF